jgi:hypothetical protein
MGSFFVSSSLSRIVILSPAKDLLFACSATRPKTDCHSERREESALAATCGHPLQILTLQDSLQVVESRYARTIGTSRSWKNDPRKRTPLGGTQ